MFLNILWFPIFFLYFQMSHRCNNTLKLCFRSSKTKAKFSAKCSHNTLCERQVEWACTEDKFDKYKYLCCGEMECYGANVVLYV